MLKGIIGVTLIIIGSIIVLTLTYAQEKNNQITIKPKLNEEVTVCFSYTLNTVVKSECRKYPKDLIGHKEFGRYGQVVTERDILKETIDKDIYDFVTVRLPEKIGSQSTVKDVTITYSDYNDLKIEGCKFDFTSKGVLC